LSTKLRERQEKIQLLLEELSAESDSGVPIIVEGRKDMETLRNLGVRGKIVMAKTGGKSRLDLISDIENACASKVILLLDFDRRGREWTAFLQEALEKSRVKTDVVFRRQLRRLAGKEVKDVEGLAGFLETLTRKVNQV
jgi:5S rRNA maturation endonuclease (ribonuclease M5)